jgi:ubiquinone/menaquinone biosynthesis C-methylase UbiE
MSVESISRVYRSKESTRASYDRMSRWYDRVAGSTEKKYQELGIQMLKAAEGERILEIGCGTGNSLSSLARNVGIDGKVIGLDISEGMLTVARRKIGLAAQSSQVELCQGDGLKLTFASNSFDAIFMSFALELFDTPEISVVLRECRRVVRSGGRICVVALSKAKRRWTVDLYEWFHRIIPDVVDCRPIFLSKALEEAGLQVVIENVTLMWSLPVEIVQAEKTRSS